MSETGVPRIVETGNSTVILSLGSTAPYGGHVKDHTTLDNELLVTLDKSGLTYLTGALAATEAQAMVDRYVEGIGGALMELADQVDDDTDPGEMLQAVMTLLGIKAVQ